MDDGDDLDRRAILRRRAALLVGALGGLGLAIAAPDAGSSVCPPAPNGALPQRAARVAASGAADASDGADASDDAGPRYDPEGVTGPPSPTREVTVDYLANPRPCLSPPCLSALLPDESAPGGCGCQRRAPTRPSS